VPADRQDSGGGAGLPSAARQPIGADQASMICPSNGTPAGTTAAMSRLMRTSVSLFQVGALGASAITLTLVTSASAADLSKRDSPPGEGATRGRDAPSRVVGHVAMGGQLNPPGVGIVAGAYVRRTLSADDRGERAYVQGGAAMTLTPAYVAPQVHVEVMPHRMLILRAEYDFIQFAGANRGLVTFGSRDVDWSESALGHARVSTGTAHKAMLRSTFRMPVGPLFLRARTDVDYYHVNADASYFYDPEHDTLAKRDDVVVASKTDLLLPMLGSGRSAGLFVGPGLEVNRTLRTELARARVGVSVTWVAADRWASISRPTIGAEAGLNLADPNRSGEPFATFGMSGEL
jgi:hypothetical protein